MIGPDQVFGFVMVRVQQRMHNDVTLGAFLIEPAFCRVTFKWLDGRMEMREGFPADEIGNAIAEADQLRVDAAPEMGQWLLGIACAFDPRSGQLTMVDKNVLSLPHLADVTVAINDLLDRSLAQERLPNVNPHRPTGKVNAELPIR